MDLAQIKSVLKEYMAIPRLCGYEKDMAYRLKSDLGRYTDDVRIDKIGNCIATFITSGSEVKME